MESEIEWINQAFKWTGFGSLALWLVASHRRLFFEVFIDPYLAINTGYNIIISEPRKYTPPGRKRRKTGKVKYVPNHI